VNNTPESQYVKKNAPEGVHPLTIQEKRARLVKNTPEVSLLE
jgi:hypothetical protein